MAHRITEVTGPAKRAGICAGDELVRANGDIIVDALDYEALTCGTNVTLELLRGKRAYTVQIRKREYQPLGLSFDTPLMSGMRMCCNRCLFCFVEQLPGCARDSLRIKDDDWRMSLMTGSYVTLTNMPPRGIERIVKRHASPLYISVHATDPDLRARLMGTDLARGLADQLDALDRGGISYHCQCVLCPGLNDGAQLEKTIEDLANRIPHALSLALVPVGLTCHREGLYPLYTYTGEEAEKVLDIADRWREKLLRDKGTRFVFPSDEFYIIAGRDLPEEEAYEDYGQIDDGVGMLRLLDTEYREAYDGEGPGSGSASLVRAVIACGVSAAPYLEKIVRERPVAGVNVNVLSVENRFFGSTVTVSGLLTGSDFARAMKDTPADVFLITETSLRDGEIFLDDMTLDELTLQAGRPVIPVGRSGEDLYRVLRSLTEEKRK